MHCPSSDILELQRGYLDIFVELWILKYMLTGFKISNWMDIWRVIGQDDRKSTSGYVLYLAPSAVDELVG